MKKYWLVVGLSLLVPGLVLGQWVFNNFEGDPFWGDQVDREENLETRAIISYVSDPAKFGQGALKIEWGATHNQSWGGGAYLNHVHPDSLGVFDFSEYDSLILWYYNESPSSLPGKVHLRFNLGDVSDSPTGYNTYSFGNMEYWYTFNYILDDPPGWRKLSFPLADVREDPQGKGFNRTGWYGIVGNDHLDLDAIKGFQLEFSISATQGAVAMGTIILDHLMLKKVDGDTMVLFRDFDRHPYWSGQVDIEEGLEHKAIVSYVSEPVKFGQAAMKIEWGATHDQSWGGGAYLNHLHPDSLEAYDFSEYDSLILWYYNESPSSLPGKVHLRFNLGDVSDSPTGYNTYSFGNMEYWYTFNYILDDPPGWRKLSFPLADVREDPQGKGFNRTGWYGIAGNDHLDLDAIKGFQLEFSISATQGDVAMGTIILDQMMLVTEGWTSVKRLTFDSPTRYSLSQNYPNPFNAATKIDYLIPVTTLVQLKLYDPLGREIKTLVNQRLSAGMHSVRLEASDLPSGVYFYHLKAGNFSQVRKMILMK